MAYLLLRSISQSNPLKEKTMFSSSLILRITFLLTFSFGTVLSLKMQAQSNVQLTKQADRYQLTVNGKPFQVKGVGGSTRLKQLQSLGGNSVRTWGVDNLGSLLDEANKHNLMVCAGIWLGHQRHGFSYQNAESVSKQLDDALQAVQKYKDHPALLLWGVGNEAEGEGNDPSVWYAINHLAREIKEIDPNHPTMTVIAELGNNELKLHNLNRFCPDIDIVGVNSYGGIESIPQRYRKSGINKPYIVTEHGPLGPWEVAKTSWGSPFERSSTEKGNLYASGYIANAMNNRDRCLGTYAFLWGNKQETTATWFGMWLPDGTRLAATDAIAELWSGKPTPNHCPKIATIDVSKSDQIKSGESIQASVMVEDPEEDSLEFEWVLRADSVTIGVGGDQQNGEREYPEAVVSHGKKVTVNLPANAKTFRLFCYVKDNYNGAAVANVPLRVGGMTQITKPMEPVELPYTLYAESDSQSVFTPSGYMGNAQAVSMQFDSTDRPKEGSNCIKITYSSGDAWGGVLWQSPAEDWDGNLPGGANLSQATELEFWARGKNGGEKVNFVFGLLDGDQPYRDTAKGELKDIVLTKDWNRYSIPLRGLDLRQIKTGFGWSLAGQGQAVTFFLDGIQYIKTDTPN